MATAKTGVRSHGEAASYAIGTIVVLPMMVVGLAVTPYLVRGPTLGAVTGEVSVALERNPHAK